MATSKKILLVDDDIDVISVMQTLLEHEGYTIITASNKKDGIRMAKEQKPALAILDVMMTSHYEGFELAKELNDDADLKRMPKLMQTSVEVFSSNNADVVEMAKEYRKDPRHKELEVILVEDIKTGKAGIDYRNEEGKCIWVSVDGFLKKPVDSKKLIPAVNRLLK
jgi:CheY-like chemotaxis protein